MLGLAPLSLVLNCNIAATVDVELQYKSPETLVAERSKNVFSLPQREIELVMHVHSGFVLQHAMNLRIARRLQPVDEK